MIMGDAMTSDRVGWIAAGVLLCVAALGGCASSTGSKESSAETEAKAAAMMRASFKSRGQAQLDRLDQDETQRACTEAGVKAPPKDVGEKIEKANLATIKWPGDGKYLGDWKKGEAIAQEGRGKQFSDDPERCRQFQPDN